MDDIKKQKLKRVSSVIEKVTGDFQEGLNRRELDMLYERKQVLKLKINTTDNEITKDNARLQLNEVEKSIDMLTGKVDVYRDIDLEVDEEAAKQYIKDNPDIFIGEDFNYEE